MKKAVTKGTQIAKKSIGSRISKGVVKKALNQSVKQGNQFVKKLVKSSPKIIKRGIRTGKRVIKRAPKKLLKKIKKAPKKLLKQLNSDGSSQSFLNTDQSGTNNDNTNSDKDPNLLVTSTSRPSSLLVEPTRPNPPAIPVLSATPGPSRKRKRTVNRRVRVNPTLSPSLSSVKRRKTTESSINNLLSRI